ncbi:PEP-CTERM sorting domain-containing protein, partial [Luteolibacter pohnpeiensis]
MAATIVDNTNATDTSAGTFDYGQSFFVPSGSAWNNIIVNFWETAGAPATDSFAVGTLYLLDSEYLGNQADLSPSTPGFIAQTSATGGGVWEFSSSITISPNTQYWIYTQGIEITPVAFNSENNYADGIAYQDVGFGYTAVPESDLAFTVSGTAVVVPEPSSALLLGIGALCFTK